MTKALLKTKLEDEDSLKEILIKYLFNKYCKNV